VPASPSVPTPTSPPFATGPCELSLLAALESAGLGDSTERAALAQTWRAWSELLSDHDAAIAAKIEQRLRVADRRRRLAKPLAVSVSLSLSLALISGLVWMEQRSRETMARLEQVRETAQRPATGSTAGPTTDARRTGATVVDPKTKSQGSPEKPTLSETMDDLATLWNDELDSQLGKAREELDSIRSAWNTPGDRLGRLAADLSERLRDLRDAWNTDTL
jgi:hypothetical protein